MSRNFPPSAKLEPLIDEQWVDEVLYQVKVGKEATVYCCRGGPEAAVDLLAAKVYHDRAFRGFRHDAVYHEGRVILDRRVRRAVEQKSRAGRAFQAAGWTAHEYQTLRLLHAAGADVPRPLTCSGDVLLMEFIGDEDGPAMLLARAGPSRDEAAYLFERLLHNVELWLACDRVHADLSPFNVLYRAGELTVIDFPQAVDPRFNPNAEALLERDIANVARYFARFGVQADPYRLAGDLWHRFLRAEL